MSWYAIDKKYINHLKKYDNLVPNNDYKNKMKCFLGIILENDGVQYFAPLTSYKPKFERLKSDIDFVKIKNPETGKIYGAINLNNMIPVTSKNYTEITFENLENFRTFKNSREKKLYWKLLCEEYNFLDEKLILKNAHKIYELKYRKPYNNVSRRCCNFKLLEEKCREYNR